MGTSNPFGGGRNGNPLIPSWIGGGGPAGGEAGDGQDQGGPAGDDGGGREPDPQPGTIQQPVPGQQSPKRYTGPRGSFTKFAKSGGEDRRALGRAVSSWVGRTGGGAATTSRRMAAERSAATSLAGVLSQASQSPGGIRDIVRTLNFGSLADRPIRDIYAALVDHICPPDGDLDDAHARDAYLEAVNEVMEAQPPDLEKPSPETIMEIIGKFIANAVNARITTGIANGSITLPTDLDEVRAVQDGLKDFIRGCVSDTMEEFRGDFREERLRPEIDQIFERVIAVIQDRGDEAANGDGE